MWVGWGWGSWQRGGGIWLRGKPRGSAAPALPCSRPPVGEGPFPTQPNPHAVRASAAKASSCKEGGKGGGDWWALHPTTTTTTIALARRAAPACRAGCPWARGGYALCHACRAQCGPPLTPLLRSPLRPLGGLPPLARHDHGPRPMVWPMLAMCHHHPDDLSSSATSCLWTRSTCWTGEWSGALLSG